MRKFILLLICCLFSVYTFGQGILVKGKITDKENGDSIEGAAVIPKGAVLGIYTDSEGQYELTVPDSSTMLAFTFIGYKTVLEKVGNRTTIDVELEFSEFWESPVVMTALGINRQKRELGYSVQELDTRNLVEVRETNLVNAFAGKIAGVQTTNGASGVGSSARIVIRGETSLSGTNQPLFVVDGVPISNELIASNTENLEGGIQEVDYGNGAAEISPDDIALVTVLKGPGAAALYGTRAANGVVVITTKDGSQSDGIGVSLHSSLTIETPLRLPQYQNQYGQGAGGTFAYEDGIDAGINDGSITSFGPAISGQLIPQFDSPSTDQNGQPVRAGDVIARAGNPIQPTPFVANPNNVRDFFQTGTTLMNNVAVSGSHDDGAFRLSFTRMDNEGMVPNTDLKRNGISFSGKQQIGEKLTARTFVNYIRSSSSHRPGVGYGSENLMYLYTWMGRQVNTESLRDYWQAGREGFNQFNYNYLWMDNPYFSTFENTNAFEKNRLLGYMQLSYQIHENLSLRARSGMDYYHDLRELKRAFSTQRFQNGAYREDEVGFQEINTDVLLTYANTLGENWDLSLSAGGNHMQQSTDYKGTEAGELSVPGIYNFGNSRNPLSISQTKAEKQIYSVYGIGRLGYQAGLFLDVTVRNDWSSTLPTSSNSFGYYSASLGWVASAFFDLPKAINYAKLRLSAASVGNDTDPFQLRNTFVFNQNYGSFPLATNPTTLLNENLKPERLNAMEVGAEIRFFEDRVGLDVSLYQNTSVDQIINLPASMASGYGQRVINGGKIQSRGLEIFLQLSPIETSHFSWRSLVNFSKNNSTVLELPEGVEQYVTGFSSVYNSTENSVFFIATPSGGGRVGDIYGTGLKQHEGKDVYDANGIPVRDPNLRLLGNYNPDFVMGLMNTFRYKRLRLNVLFDWHQGGIVVSRTLAIASTSGVIESTLPGRETGVIGEGVTNTGTNETPNYVPNTTSISAADYYGQYYNRANEANAIYDASYVKLRQISLSYELPKAWMSRVKISKASISVIGSNLFLWTENPHFDPEQTTLQGRNFAYGVEDMAYPSSRSFGMSLKINL